MARQFNFVYSAPPIALLPAQAQASLTSAYKSLRNASGKIAVIAHINQGSASTVTLALLQATNSSGAGSKAVGTNSNPPAFLNNNTATGDTLTAQSAANTFTTDTSIADKIIMWEFDPADALDLANGYNHLAVSMNAGNSANIVEAHMEYLARFQQVTPPPSEV